MLKAATEKNTALKEMFLRCFFVSPQKSQSRLNIKRTLASFDLCCHLGNSHNRRAGRVRFEAFERENTAPFPSPQISEVPLTVRRFVFCRSKYKSAVKRGV